MPQIRSQESWLKSTWLATCCVVLGTHMAPKRQLRLRNETYQMSSGRHRAPSQKPGGLFSEANAITYQPSNPVPVIPLCCASVSSPAGWGCGQSNLPRPVLCRSSGELPVRQLRRPLSPTQMEPDTSWINKPRLTKRTLVSKAAMLTAQNHSYKMLPAAPGPADVLVLPQGPR